MTTQPSSQLDDLERRRALLAQLAGIDQWRRGILHEVSVLEQRLGLSRATAKRTERRGERQSLYHQRRGIDETNR